MRPIRPSSLFLLGFLMLCGIRVSAQMVGDCVFLQGRYVEVGVAPNGGYGTTLPTPGGYHANAPTFNFWDPGAGSFTSSNQFLGFVADYGRDGWGTGTPGFFGDYYLPGTPQEGWAIQYAGATGPVSNAYIPTYMTAGTTGYLPTGSMGGTNTSYYTLGGVMYGVWRGSKGALAIRQTTRLDSNKLFFTVNVVIRNTSAATVNGIYYVRTVDPDNVEITLGAAYFTTSNTITYQLPNPGNKVLVSAVDTASVLATHSYLGLGTKDCRAKCMIFDGGLAPGYNLDAMWNQSTPYYYNVGTNYISDVGIALDYNIGSLAPGDSTSLTYAYILNAADIDSALDATQPIATVNGTPFLSGDTVNLCVYGSDTINMTMGNAGFYRWHWAPNTFISDTAGTYNTINVTGITGSLTYTVVGINTSGACDTVRYFLTLSHDTFNIFLNNRDTAICRGDAVQARVTGPATLNYSWSPTAGVSNSTIANPILSPTTTTTYTVTGSSSATGGCPPVSRSFTIGVINPRIDSVTFTNPTVCGYADGTMMLYGLQTGFPDTLHYSVNGVPQTPVPVGVSSSGTVLVTGLRASTISNIWIKVGPCPTNVVGPITLVNPAPPTVAVDSHYIQTCVGVSTLIHSFVTPSTIRVNYAWTPPAYLSTTTAANTIVTPSVAGDITYTVTVNPGTDPSCNSIDTVRVHAIAPFVLNNVDTVICIGRSVTARVTGPNEYNYLWTPTTGVSNPNIKTPVMTPTVSTEYVVTASYAHCPDQSDSFHIEVDTPAIPRTVIDTICLGMSDSFDFTVPGTRGTSEYTYAWSTAVMSDLSNPSIANPIIRPSTVGTNFYALTVRPAAANCAVTNNVILFVIDTNITIRPAPDTAICLGKFVQIVGNGDPLFRYQWLPTAGIAISNVLNAFITPDTSAMYVVTANYGRCPTIRRQVFVDVQPNPFVYAGGNRFLCEFDTLHIDAIATPAWYSSRYRYSWTPAANLDNTTRSTVVYSGTSNTKIYVTVSTSAGCSAKDSMEVIVYPGNFASLTPDHYAFCPHDSASPVINITGGAAGTSYRWYPSRYLSDSTSANPVMKPVSSTVFTIVATTINGCKDTLNYYTTVYPAALISVPDSVTIYPGESYQIPNFTNCNTFKWTPPYSLNSDVVSNPVATPEVSTKYIVHGVTTDGCMAIDSILINVESESVIVMPNGFTPGNGRNSQFKVILKGMASLNHFRVYNRWGQVVFETTNISEGWDGTFNGEPQPLGVYVYQVEAVTSNGTPVLKHGNVTLLR